VQVDRSQYPLLEAASEIVRGESAVAKRELRPPAELAESTQVLPPSLELEFLAEVGSLVYPDRVLLGMKDVRWFARTSEPPASAKLVGRARREADGMVIVHVSVEPEGLDGEAQDSLDNTLPVCRGLLQFGHVYRPAPWRQPLVLDMAAEHLHNGRALYESTGPSGGVPEALQVIDWARLCELGRIQGGLVYPRHLVKSLPPGRLQVAAPALEGTLHLVQWLWYAFAGEGSRPMAMAESTWYRLPRRDEQLACDVQLRGASGGLASFDAGIHGQDGVPILELRGIGAASQPAGEPEKALPRLAWQSFVKRLTLR
jgi:hypothetical protein